MIGVGGGATTPAATASPGRVTERDAWIALSQVPGIGPAGFARLLRRHGSAVDAWRRGPPLPDDGRPSVARNDWPRDPRAVARSIEERTAALGGRVVTAVE